MGGVLCCGIKEAQEGDLTFLANPKYAHLVASTKAAAVVVEKGWKITTDKPLIRVSNPSLAFSTLIELFGPKKITFPPGIHKLALVSKEAKIGAGVSVGPFAVVEEGVEVGVIVRVGRCGVNVGVGVGVAVFRFDALH